MYQKIKKYGGKGPVKVPVAVEATKIELLTKCLLEGIDYKTVINNTTIGSEIGTSSKKVTPMKSSHTAHSSPLPTAKKPYLQKSGSSTTRYECNFTGGNSETKLRKSAGRTPDGDTTKFTSSINDRSSITFENLADGVSYHNYQPINRVKRDLEQERRAIVGKKIDAGATSSGYSQLAGSTVASSIMLKPKAFNYSAKKHATPSKATASSPSKKSSAVTKA